MNRIDYQQKLTEALEIQKAWHRSSELPKLKSELRTFQTSFATLYTYLLKKGLVGEDPYKHESRVGEIQVPDTKVFSENENKEQLSIRLASYDNQLDFLVNFYQFNIEFFTLERIRRIQNLISYINWVHLSVDSEDINTRSVAELVIKARTAGDNTALSIVNGTLTNLMMATASINDRLNLVQEYNREAYKLELRDTILKDMAGTPTLNLIKQKFTVAIPESVFYSDMAEEVLKEDYSPEGNALQEQVLDKLKVAAEETQKPLKEVTLKDFLLEGLQALGTMSPTLNEIWIKFDENETVLENKTVSTWAKLRQFFERMLNLNQEEDPEIYEVEYTETNGGTVVREQVNFRNFMFDLEAKAKNLASITRNAETQTESHLFDTLDRLLRDLQARYKTLSALDDYFKSHVDIDERSLVKGVKPELATIKNTLIKANQRRSEYLSQKEEAAQLKRLGIGAE
jgi:hypothetical protein